MELDPKLIVAIIAFLAALTALVKQITDNLKIKSDRASTAQVREKDSLEIHDTLLKQGFQIQQCRDSLTLYQTVQEDLKTELNLLNTNVAKLTVVVEGLRETVKDMKDK